LEQGRGLLFGTEIRVFQNINVITNLADISRSSESSGVYPNPGKLWWIENSYNLSIAGFRLLYPGLQLNYSPYLRFVLPRASAPGKSNAPRQPALAEKQREASILLPDTKLPENIPK
jgi:hypothetical protein